MTFRNNRANIHYDKTVILSHFPCFFGGFWFVLYVSWTKCWKWGLLCKMRTKWGPFQQFGPHEDQFLNWGPFQAFRYRIWDLARKLATKAKFKPFGQNQDFFETISRLFCDFLSLFSWKLPQNLHKIKGFKKHVVVTFSAKSGLFLGSTLGHSSCTNVQKPGCG